MTRKYNIVSDQPNTNCNEGNEVVYNIRFIIIEVLSLICVITTTLTLVRGNITIAGNIAARVTFKYYTPFTKSITKIDGSTKDEPEDLHLVMTKNA